MKHLARYAWNIAILWDRARSIGALLLLFDTSVAAALFYARSRDWCDLRGSDA